MAAIFGERKFFLKTDKSIFLDTVWVENIDEIAVSRTVNKVNITNIYRRL